MPGSLADHDTLATAWDALCALPAGADETFAVLAVVDAAEACDPRALCEPSVLAWAGRRVATYRRCSSSSFTGIECGRVGRAAA